MRVKYAQNFECSEIWEGVVATTTVGLSEDLRLTMFLVVKILVINFS